jgi:hypothetical protein
LKNTQNQGNKMDPITAIAIASTAFNAIKRGIEVGRDIESMSGDLGRWMGAIGSIKDAENKAKNPPLFRSIFNPGSVEQEAIEAFSAKKKAEAMEYDLKIFVNLSYGPNAWNEILRMQGQIRKQRLAEKKKQQELLDNIGIGLLVFLCISISLVMIYFVLMNM